jgi:hypothetical protein
MKDKSTDDDCSRSGLEWAVGTACKAVVDVKVVVEAVVAVVVLIIPWLLLLDRRGVVVVSVGTATACDG